MAESSRSLKAVAFLLLGVVYPYLVNEQLYVNHAHLRMPGGIWVTCLDTLLITHSFLAAAIIWGGRLAIEGIRGPSRTWRHITLLAFYGDIDRHVCRFGNGSGSFMVSRNRFDLAC